MDFSRYTREAMADTRKIEYAKLCSVRKKFYNTFLQSWDTAQYGQMPPARFYPKFHHLIYEEDFIELRKWYRWAEKHNFPFAPIAWVKFGLHTDKERAKFANNALMREVERMLK